MVYCKKFGRYINGKKLKMIVCTRCKQLRVQNGNDVEFKTPLVRFGKEENTICILHMTNADHRKAFEHEIKRVMEQNDKTDMDAFREVWDEANRR